ncbi:gallinacin-10-like [Neopelma chrysocephalum]|uniref:gallinacin-10-like n=1 Tax=Neopelma chrysocephalum TaxID=114329 RepID=UPI000FCCF910|nr:gallinacin-10-like [Neopelma chrysocephalum]
MKILYLLFAVFLLIFQATSGSADPLFADTAECKSQGKGNFCLAGACPPTFTASGTCQNGMLNCCSK